MIEITDEMLDIIEKVKGKRNPALWDPRCEQYMRNNSKGTVKKSTTSQSNLKYPFFLGQWHFFVAKKVLLNLKMELEQLKQYFLQLVGH